jgi:pyruvate dehydrogenase E1 component alpha subunit
MAEGEFHEAMNLAALWHLPVLFCCENNLYAMGTSLRSSESQTDLALKASSYQMPAWSVDGMDPDKVAEVAGQALATVRGSGGPVFLELKTYRFRAHSMFDPDLYRNPAEVEQWKLRDPIAMFAQRLMGEGELTAEAVEQLWEAARAEVERAVEFAEAAELEPVEQLRLHVTAGPGPNNTAGPGPNNTAGPGPNNTGSNTDGG